VPQLAVPRVLVAVRAEAHLHVQFGDGGDPTAECLEEPHLDPLVVADPASRLLDVEGAGQLASVPRSECGTGLFRVGHGVPPLSGLRVLCESFADFGVSVRSHPIRHQLSRAVAGDPRTRGTNSDTEMPTRI